MIVLDHQFELQEYLRVPNMASHSLECISAPRPLRYLRNGMVTRAGGEGCVTPPVV